MTKAIASYNELECGEYRCTRVATQVDPGFVGSSYPFSGAGTPVEKFARGLRCNIHVGANKRSRWVTPVDYVPVSGFPREVAGVLADRLERRNKQNADRDAQQRENALIYAARFAREWVERTEEPPYTVERGTYHSSYEGFYADGYRVFQDSKNADSWYTVQVKVEQRKNEPATVGVTSTGSWSPEQARAIARALMLAANLADERDILTNTEIVNDD